MPTRSKHLDTSRQDGKTASRQVTTISLDRLGMTMGWVGMTIVRAGMTLGRIGVTMDRRVAAAR